MVGRACRPRPLDGRSLGERWCARHHRHHRSDLPAGQRQLHPVERWLLHPWQHRSVLRDDAGPTSATPRPTTRAAPSWCVMTARAGTGSSTRRRSTRPATTGARMIRYAGEHRWLPYRRYGRLREGQGPGDASHRRSDGVAFTGPAPDITVWGAALSVMHVPTGLFVQGHYNHSGLQCAAQRRAAVTGVSAAAPRRSLPPVDDPGRYPEELVRLRQHVAVRRIRRGQRLGCIGCRTQLRRDNCNCWHVRARTLCALPTLADFTGVSTV